MTIRDSSLPEWRLLTGEEMWEPFIEGRAYGSGHNEATYAIARGDAKVTQDGTHGLRCECDDWPCPHLIASDEPYYNTAPSREDAELIVRAVNFYLANGGDDA